MVTFLGQVCVICFLQPSHGVNGDFVLPGFEVVFKMKRGWDPFRRALH